MTGSLSPIPVRGIAYATPTEEGMTNDAGEFAYREGERVEFHLGDTRLGTALGAESITLFDLHGAPRLTEVGEIAAALEDRGSAYTAAANLISLLHSLDDNLDVGDGIAIDDATRALFDGLSLSFREQPPVFASAVELRRMLGELDRTLMRTEMSLAQQFEAGSIALSDGGVRLSRRRAEDHIAVSDSAPVTTTHIETGFDTLGSVLSTTIRDGEGKLRSSTAYRYDAAGHRVASEGDSDGDGQLDYRWAIMRDVSGNAVESVHRFGEGLQEVERNVYIYDQWGRNVRTESDRGDDGSIEQYFHTHYLDNGEPGRVEFDRDGDGISEEVLSYTYNTDNQLVRSRFEGRGADFKRALEGLPPMLGLADRDPFDPTLPYPEESYAILVGVQEEMTDRTTSFTYNDKGFLVHRLTDIDSDGAADQITRFTYEGDHLVAWGFDKDGDGIEESFARYTYNEMSQLVRVEQTDGRFVPFKVEETRRLYYDTAGRVERIVVQGGNNNPNAGERRYHYDTLGNVRELSYDYDADGSVDARSVSEWEPSFRLDDSNSYNR